MLREQLSTPTTYSPPTTIGHFYFSTKASFRLRADLGTLSFPGRTMTCFMTRQSMRDLM
jgi:hypothetical protein